MTVFSQNQLAALKYQIMAYKMIQKDTPLPSNLQQVVLAPFHTLNSANNSHESPVLSFSSPSTPIINKQRKYFSTSSATAAATTTIALKSTATPLQSQQHVPREPEYNAYVAPSQLYIKPISSYAHASRQQRLLVPSITPTGIDVKSILSQREQRILARMKYTMEQAEQENDIKTVTHVKALKLYEKQQKLRNEFIGGMNKSTQLCTSIDRIVYRRMKKFTLRDSRHVEQMERQQRHYRENTLKQEKQHRLNTIIEHGINLLNIHHQQQSKQSKLGKAVIQYHHHIEKEEQKRIEKIQKERIQALKNDDEEAYMKLIDEQKDTRLTHLLKQTGQFLEKLTKSVLDQQNDVKSMASKYDFMTGVQDEDEVKYTLCG